VACSKYARTSRNRGSGRGCTGRREGRAGFGLAHRGKYPFDRMPTVFRRRCLEVKDAAHYRAGPTVLYTWPRQRGRPT
jgi:hypothetical protein